MSGTYDERNDIPKVLMNSKNGDAYTRLRFFGRGSDAKCYEIKDVKTGCFYAGKIVPKRMKQKPALREQMTQEISIHKSLRHPNIVEFLHCFDDSKNVYIVMELCKRSMMELHKRRPTVTNYECRFFMHQLLEGVKYLHEHRIIHRNLSLSHIFLNNDLNLKIGGFGNVTRIEYEGERKKTICGTPNYIAPEILNECGYSFEVDIWAIGCVMFALLVGQPPFETRSLEDIYARIRQCDYRLPQTLHKNAAELIVAMLQSDPKKRPTVQRCLEFDFLKGRIPQSLPISCLSCEPRIDQLE